MEADRRLQEAEARLAHELAAVRQQAEENARAAEEERQRRVELEQAAARERERCVAG